MTKRTTRIAALIGLALASPAISEAGPDTAQAAHTAYLAAINSNSLERFLETVTDDVVFIAPGTPIMEGKAEVAPWVNGYFDAVQTSWNKQSLEFVESADWAFERYAFTATDIPHGPGPTTVSTGYGINIYHRQEDGIWRVARDIWSNSSTEVQQVSPSLVPVCSGPAGPC